MIVPVKSRSESLIAAPGAREPASPGTDADGGSALDQPSIRLPKNQVGPWVKACRVKDFGPQRIRIVTETWLLHVDDVIVDGERERATSGNDQAQAALQE